MAISYVTSVTGTTSATISGILAGDCLVAFAGRSGSVTAPTLPAGWTLIDNAGGANTSSTLLAYRFATTTSQASGTFTNASEVTITAYRGVDQNNPIGTATNRTTGTATSVTYPAATLQATDGSSWILRFGFHKSINTTIETPPTGYTLRANLAGASAGEVAAFDSNGTVSTSPGTAAVAVGGTAAGWMTHTLEIRAAVAGSKIVSGTASIVAGTASGTSGSTKPPYVSPLVYFSDSQAPDSATATSATITGVSLGTAFSGRVISALVVYQANGTVASVGRPTFTIGGVTATASNFYADIDASGTGAGPWINYVIIQAVVPTGTTGDLVVSGSSTSFLYGGFTLIGPIFAFPAGTGLSVSGIDDGAGNCSVPANGTLVAYDSYSDATTTLGNITEIWAWDTLAVSPNLKYRVGAQTSSTAQTVTGLDAGAFAYSVSTPPLPTPVSSGQTAWNTISADMSSSSIAVQAGDLIVVWQLAENGGAQLQTPTDTGSNAWTKQLEDGAGNNNITYVAAYTATAAATGSIVISRHNSNANQRSGFAWQVWRNAAVGAKAIIDSYPSTGLPSLALTTLADYSAVSMASGDWDAVVGTATWGSTPGLPTQQSDFADGASYGVHVGSYSDVNTAGAKTIAMTAPTGQLYTTGAIEIQYSAGATSPDGTASGATVSATGSVIAGTATGTQNPTIAGQTVSGTASVIAGSATGAATAPGGVVQATAGLTAGAATGTSNATGGGILISAASAVTGGGATGTGNGTATGATIAANATLTAATATGGATVPGQTIQASTAVLAGGASGAGSATAPGDIASAASAIVAGTATGQRNPTVAGATLAATAALAAGGASGVQSPTVAGQILTGTASLISNGASGASLGQAPGAVVIASATLVPGTATGTQPSGPGATFSVGGDKVIRSPLPTDVTDVDGLIATRT